MAELMVTRGTLAKVLKLSTRTVSTLEASGVFQPATGAKRGQASRFDLTVVIPSYIAHVTATPGSRAGALADARRRQAEARARLLEQEADSAAGRTVSLAEAKREAFEAARLIRDRLQAIPGRVASAVAAETDVNSVTRLLDDAVREVLTVLADDLEKGPDGDAHTV